MVLPDAPHDSGLLTDPDMQWAFHRWQEDSPLRRAALAGMAYLQGRGADLDDVDLAGSRLPTPRRLAGHRSEPRWWINWKWRGHAGIPYCVTRGDCWVEGVHPTRTRPLDALIVEPGPHAAAFRE
ncbi:hypothetical protein ACIQ6Y_32340 [Streptomyces sp. NPDC096205]|uniref:hypothetical protein n=1 Tax=Streptomyces sp. NPDC096205 TaxID=3366081 RepID=UPI003804D745